MKSFNKLSSRGQIGRLRKMALRALEHYNLEIAKVQVITIERNGIFRADATDGRRYVLRINRPGERRLIDTQSELLWLTAIQRDTSLITPQPIPTCDGDLCITVDVPGVPEPRECVLFSWVPGRNLNNPSIQSAFKIGEAMAILHNHADTFTPSEDFTDLKWNSVWPFVYPEVIYSNEPHPLFKPKHRTLFRRAAEHIQKEMDNLYADPAGMRFLHGDMNPWNMRLDHGKMHVIDFGDSCWLYPIQDIAIANYYLPRITGHREAFKNGYVSLRPWPEAYDGQIELFTIARRLHITSILINLDGEEWVAMLPSWVERSEMILGEWLAAIS